MSSTDRRKFIKSAALGLPLLASIDISAQGRKEKAFRRPVVVSTWDSGIRANAAAWKVLSKKGTALDAVEQAARSAEDEVSCCVGLDGFPDRDGYVTLDASIMDDKANCGSVVFLEHIRNPVSVARRIMEKTEHVILAGDGALQFAIENGFERLPHKLSPEADEAWKEWLKKSEYRPVVNLENAPKRPKGPSTPTNFDDGTFNHDTMGTIALDAAGNLSGACTTSGMAFKMHGRVGDSPVIGAGLFVDNKVGAATSSGVGEEVVRICGTHLIIELMRFGYTPEKACAEAVRRIVERDRSRAEKFQVGFIAISKNGVVGAFSIQKGFTYSVTNDATNEIFEAKSYFK